MECDVTWIQNEPWKRGHQAIGGLQNVHLAEDWKNLAGWNKQQIRRCLKGLGKNDL